MHILRCKNGHYFDTDEYVSCPMCDAAVAEDKEEIKTEVHSQEKKSKGGWLSGKKGIFGEKKKLQSDDCKYKEDKIAKEIKEIKESDWDFEMFDDDPTEGMSMSEPEECELEIPQNDKANSLRAVINQVSANEDGKTTGYFMSRYENTSESAPVRNEPVVGWMVCIKGNHFGESFEVFSGKNSIGRNNDNRIVLSKDGGISREKHAYIIFDPKNTEYYLQPGDGNGLVYVNGSFVPVTQKINNKDVIGLSNCELMLFSLCDEDFSWDRYIKE